jgi:hypothetical protein
LSGRNVEIALELCAWLLLIAALVMRRGAAGRARIGRRDKAIG